MLCSPIETAEHECWWDCCPIRTQTFWVRAVDTLISNGQLRAFPFGIVSGSFQMSQLLTNTGSTQALLLRTEHSTLISACRRPSRCTRILVTHGPTGRIRREKAGLLTEIKSTPQSSKIFYLLKYERAKLGMTGHTTCFSCPASQRYFIQTTPMPFSLFLVVFTIAVWKRSITLQIMCA